MAQFIVRTHKLSRMTGLLVMLACVGIGSAQQVRPGMSLAEIIGEVLAKNAGISASKLAVDAADLGRSVATRQRLPKLDWFVNYEGFPLEDKLLSPRHMDIPTPPFTQEFMVDFFQRQFNTQIVNTGLTVTLPLYTGGRIAGTIGIQRAMVQQAEMGLKNMTDNLVFAVERTYAKALLLKKIVEANEKAVESLTESRRTVRKLLEVGRVTNVELFRINTRLAEVEQSLIEARFDLQRSYGLLNSLMGRNVTDELHVIGSLPYPEVEFSLQESLRQTFETNPEYLTIRTLAMAQSERVRIARSERVPNLSVMGSYKGAYGDVSPDPSSSGAVFLKVSVPLFHGGIIRSNVEKEELLLKKIEQQREALKQRLSQEVYTAHLGMVKAERQIEVAEIAVLEAEESLRIEKQKLDQGKGVVRDLLDAQADFLRTQVKYHRALSDHAIAVADLKRIMGTIRSGSSKGE